MNSNSNKQKDILESVAEQIFTRLPSKKKKRKNKTKTKSKPKTHKPETNHENKHTQIMSSFSPFLKSQR